MYTKKMRGVYEKYELFFHMLGTIGVVVVVVVVNMRKTGCEDSFS